MTIVSSTIRDDARALALEERNRRMELCRRLTDHALLDRVVGVGVGGGEWRSSSDCAARAFAISDRNMRRWLADRDLVLPRAVREKLLSLCWQFGIDPS